MSPISISTEPSAWRVKLRVILTVRSWSGWRWLGRMGFPYSFGLYLSMAIADFVDRLFDLLVAQLALVGRVAAEFLEPGGHFVLAHGLRRNGAAALPRRRRPPSARRPPTGCRDAGHPCVFGLIEDHRHGLQQVAALQRHRHHVAGHFAPQAIRAEQQDVAVVERGLARKTRFPAASGCPGNCRSCCGPGGRRLAASLIIPSSMSRRMREWSLVWAMTRPLRIRYRRESPACAQ